VEKGSQMLMISLSALHVSKKRAIENGGSFYREKRHRKIGAIHFLTLGWAYCDPLAEAQIQIATRKPAAAGNMTFACEKAGRWQDLVFLV